MVAGWNMTPVEAAKSESELARDPENLPSRLRLMSYYGQRIENDALVRHLVWLVEHHPDADLFWDGTTRFTRVPRPDSYANQVLDSARVEALWRQQAQRFASNAKVLRNAAIALASVDVNASLDLISAARRVEPANIAWTNWLARNYARAIRFTFWDGKNPMTLMSDGDQLDVVLPLNVPLALAQQLRDATESSNDPALVRAVGESVLRETQNLPSWPNGLTPDVPLVSAYAEALIAKAAKMR
jgi:hypothetical protein